MAYGYKKFDINLYRQNDERARILVASTLRAEGLDVADNPDQYSVDLLVSKPGSPNPFLAVECEIKRVWESGWFPGHWNTLQIPARKRKYIDQSPYWVEYWVLNAAGTHAMIVPEDLLVRSPLVVVSNKYVPNGEKFYQVPVSECIQVELYLGN